VGVGVGVGVAVGVGVDVGRAVGVLTEPAVLSPVAGSGMGVELEVSPTTAQAASVEMRRRKLSVISGRMVRFIYYPCEIGPDYR
jgi:hypothetical protein